MCPDYFRYTCALNLALQLHLSVWDLERTDTSTTPTHNDDFDGISDWSELNHVPFEGDYLSLDLPPIGLTRDLWLRLVECCRGLSPHLAPGESDCNHVTIDTPTLGQTNGDCEHPMVPVTVPGVDRLPSPTSNGEHHFTRVHEFSAKEEQLRAHAHDLAQPEPETVPGEPGPVEERIAMLTNCRHTGQDSTKIASTRKNEDYLPGMWSEMTAAPFTWRPERLEDGVVPMAGYNTNNAWCTETDCSLGAASKTPGETWDGGKPCLRLHNVIVRDRRVKTVNGANWNVNGDERKGDQVNEHDSSECDTDQNHRHLDMGGDDDGDDEEEDEEDGEENSSHEQELPSTPPTSKLVRRVSILRLPSLNTDGEPVKSPPKRVRFSLGAAHPSPALEAEYGGRSNRRRLLDFARRRQLLTRMGGPHPSDGLDSPYHFLVQANIYLLHWFARCLRGFFRLLYSLFSVRWSLFLLILVAFSLLIGFIILFCSFTLQMPWEQLLSGLPDTQSANDSTRLTSGSATAMSSSNELVCRSVFHWLRDYLPIRQIMRLF
ncbi:unnamed protein product [Echinostoma caproni]|uniref:Uncharacterized protein n=1 Tax=Echinostoma caproni TaxID=27848 RepID=A0A183A995_9TREM|nr:unnamed protein product [Echinostoma caproni]